MLGALGVLFHDLLVGQGGIGEIAKLEVAFPHPEEGVGHQRARFKIAGEFLEDAQGLLILAGIEAG